MSIIQKAVQAQDERRAERAAADPHADLLVDTPSGRGTPPRPAAPAGRPTTIAAFAPLAANGFLQIDPGDPASRSELRHLKRSILQSAFSPLSDGGANVVMITSPMPGAGKTFLSANLAQALAMELDRTTLLIDADDTRATMSRALGLNGVPGFFDVLNDPALPVESCVYDTDVSGLEFMPAGGRFDHALELLTSNRARDLFKRLAEANRNRLVVIDCPPLLGTPNAVALSSLAGQILVVVEAGVTSNPTIKQALEQLDRDKPIGLVLNKIPRTSLLALANGSYYYYSGPDSE